MPNNFCPICQKKFKDILRHFSLCHDIDSMEKLTQEVDKAEKKEGEKEAFSLFIKELNDKLAKHQIEMDEWKRLRDNWKYTG